MPVKRKKLFLVLLALSLSAMLCGCGIASNPLEKVRATAVPGLSMELHPASASQENVDTFQASLYYRFGEEPMLAAEPRTLKVRRDESKELVLLEALLEGPSAGHSELKRLFPETVRVESVSAQRGILYITFNEALLRGDGIPADWRQRPDWVREAPLLRALTIQSAVASITESFPYTGVQILVYDPTQVQSSLRLHNSYFLNDLQGLSEPLARDESLLLTPQNTAARLMAAWQSREYGMLYPYIAKAQGSEARPSLQAVSSALDAAPALGSFTVSGGSVSPGGGNAVVTVQYSLLGEDGVPVPVSYPLPLVRENDLWKIAYAQLLALMVPAGS